MKSLLTKTLPPKIQITVVAGRGVEKIRLLTDSGSQGAQTNGILLLAKILPSLGGLDRALGGRGEVAL